MLILMGIAGQEGIISETPDQVFVESENFDSDLIQYYINKLITQGSTIDPKITRIISYNPFERTGFLLHKINELLLVSSFSDFEYYLLDISTAILLNDKDAIFQTLKKQRQKREAGFNNGKLDDDLTDALIQIRSRGIKSYSDFFKKALGLDIKSFENVSALFDINRFKRNCLVHNNGTITAQNFSRMGYEKKDIEGKITISLKDFFKCQLNLFQMASIIDITVLAKFGAEKINSISKATELDEI